MQRLQLLSLLGAAATALACQFGCSSAPAGVGTSDQAAGGPGAGAGGARAGSGGALANAGTLGSSGASGTRGGAGGEASVAGSGGSAGMAGAAGGIGTGGGAGLAGAAGIPATGGSAGGIGGSGGGSGGSGGECTTGNCPPVTCTSYPTLPGASASPLYGLTASGAPLFVEKLSKFSPEMQVHYAHCSLSAPGVASFAVTIKESFSSYTLSPKSRNITVTKNGSTLNFSSGPNYLVLQVDAKELFFLLIDAPEVNPPKLGDPNVKNLADYGVDNTGATLVTSKVQSAIDAASGATQDILYVPPGKYKVGELWLKSHMTLYLAGGAVLYGSDATADFDTGSGGINIEGCSHGMIRMYGISDTKVLGRGVLDANGKLIRSKNDTKINLFKIEQSSNILIDGVTVRDPSFWNTLIYRSDLVTIQNYKMINCRPTTTTYNNTDGVDFDESTNGKLSNAFLYTGDDSMATKNEEATGTIDTKNILHEKVVSYSNSVGCKIGTKTMGKTIDGVVFRDIDVIKAGRALNIDAYDTAVVQNTKFEDIRIEAADSSMIALSEDDPPTWRTAANTSIIKDTYFTNVSSAVKKPINLHGRSASVNITGVHFSNLSVQGKAVTSQTDSDASFSINSFVSNIVFGP